MKVLQIWVKESEAKSVVETFRMNGFVVHANKLSSDAFGDVEGPLRITVFLHDGSTVDMEQSHDSSSATKQAGGKAVN